MTGGVSGQRENALDLTHSLGEMPSVRRRRRRYLSRGNRVRQSPSRRHRSSPGGPSAPVIPAVERIDRPRPSTVPTVMAVPGLFPGRAMTSSANGPRGNGLGHWMNSSVPVRRGKHRTSTHEGVGTPDHVPKSGLRPGEERRPVEPTRLCCAGVPSRSSSSASNCGRVSFGSPGFSSRFASVCVVSVMAPPFESQPALVLARQFQVIVCGETSDGPIANPISPGPPPNRR
jgi:hypothetical protein